MIILEINAVNFGSTGNIMLQIAEKAEKEGIKVYTACVKSRSNAKKKVKSEIPIGNRFMRNISAGLAFLTGIDGGFNLFSTYAFLKKADAIRPDLIHLHNLHNNFINLPMLFRYIKKHNIPALWTLHDCWAFTGHCTYCDMIGCDKWKSGCHHCPQYKDYPKSLFDNAGMMWRLKKRWFSGVKNLTVATPSKWLAGLVGQSYLKEYPVSVINNGVDLSVFMPVSSDFKERYRIPAGKHILLGVASGWEKRKGLDVFLTLEKRLDREKFQIVLVGTDDFVDKLLPDSIISVHHTQNQRELAKIYIAADVFVNPTREDNFPTVNMEALACGTPVVTFRTGGSPESPDGTCGAVVDKDDVDAMEREIIRICEEKPFRKEACLKRAKQFDIDIRFREYAGLYKCLSQNQ